ncbi:MAG: uracil-DNA glycosylase [Rhizobiaceae bacterium]
MLNTSINSKELLAWYVDAGVDIALSDEPINRFEETANKKSVPNKSASTAAQQPKAVPQAKQQQPSSPTQNERAVPDINAVENAIAAAKTATTIDELRLAVEGFKGCNLKFAARSTVFADGNPKAKLMIIGKAPGREEDAQGVPFVGPNGQLLDRMLFAIGLDRTQVYLTNCIPWRPPGGKTPSAPEIEICRPFIERHIELVAPDHVLIMGGACASMMLQSKNNIMGLRGKWTEITVGDVTIPTLPTLHPDYLLKTPAHKNMAWQDLLTLKEKLQEKSK